MSWGGVTCGLVDNVDHPESEGGKSRGSDIGKYPALTFFLKISSYYKFNSSYIKK